MCNFLHPPRAAPTEQRIQRDIASAEHFVLVTAFATSDGIALLEPAMRKCLEAGGQGTLVLALDRQHFNAADVFERLASLVKSFTDRLEVRIVREFAGLLHAKAVFAKLPDGTATLLVGSANLTEKAFTQNHELGLWVNLLGEPEVSRAFQRFAQSLGGTRHDAAELSDLARYLGVPRSTNDGTDVEPRPKLPPPPWPFGTDPTPPSIPIETFVGDWLQAGYIVGRGRRGLEVLVIRTPGEQLEQLGLIERKAKQKIAAATEKTVTAGYGVRLLPDVEDERLRKDARKMWSILGKLTLNLPCFGLWMPRAYWDLFQQAAAAVQAAGISTADILAAARKRHRELDGVGIEREIDAIVADLQRDGLAKPGRKDDLHAELLVHFRPSLPSGHRISWPVPSDSAQDDRRWRRTSTSAPSLARSSSIWCNRPSRRPTARGSGPGVSARSWGARSPRGSPNGAWLRVRNRATL